MSGSVDVDMVDEISIASASIPTQRANESNTVLAKETVDHLREKPLEIRSSAPVCHGGTSTILNRNTTSPSWDMKVTRTYIDYNDDESNKDSKRLKSGSGSRITIYQPVRKLEATERSSNFGQEKVWLEAEEALERKDSLKFTPLEQLDADTQAAVRQSRLEHKKLRKDGSSALTLNTDLGQRTMGDADIPATLEPDSGVELDDYFADDEASSPTSSPTPPPPSPQFSLIGHAGKPG